ncbi:MAG: histidine phosphatase family protein [Pseudohongiellaceae bacterium]
MRLHLIRHGQTDWNAIRRIQGQTDSSLNELGRQQARQLAAILDHYEFDQVYCSSSLRTRQTAEQLFSHRQLPVTYLDTLREIDLGPWEGLLYAEIEQSDPNRFDHFFNAPHLFQLEGAENYRQLQHRATTAIEEIRRKHSGEEIAVVSHGALIKSLLNHLEGKPLAQLWDPPLMHNCSHTIIEFNQDGSSEILKTL